MSTKPELNLNYLDSGKDYVLKPEQPDGSSRVWITVGDATVRIMTCDGCLAVATYVLGHEMNHDYLEQMVFNLAELAAQKAEWDDEVTKEAST